MSGIKGRSGRRGLAYEIVEDKRISEILNLSTLAILQYLKNPNISDDKKAFISLEMVKRRVGDRKDIKVKAIPAEEQAILDRYIQRSAIQSDKPEQIEDKRQDGKAPI